MLGPEEHIVKGKEIMVRCEIVENYQGSCVAKVKLPNGKVEVFHLNSFLPPGLKPYKGWEYEEEKTSKRPFTESDDEGDALWQYEGKKR